MILVTHFLNQDFISNDTLGQGNFHHFAIR
jgi:hypothetical protein